MHLQTKALVLRETAYKESDKILTLLTQEAGRLTASARGCRRKGSPIAAGSQLLVWSDVVLHEYRGRWTVQEAAVDREFRGMREDLEKFVSGIQRFCVGLAKKVLLANSIGALWEDCLAAQGAGTLTVLGGWLGLAAYGFQIYFDFSGYSDMAIGLGKMFGFHFLENFNYPYISRSITEFWRRWHISLSAWFRDYLYIPLGGSRRGRTRKYLNILLVFAVSGLWHGAALTFVVWGLLNGIYQVAGGLTARLRARCRQSLRMREDRPLTVLWQMAVTFVLATLAWVFFKAGSLSGALSVLRAMLPAGPALVHPVLASMGLDRREFLAAALAGLALLAVDLLSLRGSVRARVLALPRPLRWLVALILLLCVFLFGVYGTGYDPQDFIYFKF